MATVSEHYENLLAEYFPWMFGDFDTHVESNREFFNAHGITPQTTGLAADLGAGPGFQSLALGQLGFSVVAVDLSRKLLDVLEEKRDLLPVKTVQGDLLDFSAHLAEPLEVCVCMGDTLTHLESLDRVSHLFRAVYRALEPGGKFILTFRDLTHELEGLDRFIPVRSDDNTIFTCCLEYEPEHVRVHDLVYTRDGDRWELRKSWFRKLRIAPAWVIGRLKEAGFNIIFSENACGVITVIARNGRK